MKIINLLPPEEQKQLRQEKIFANIKIFFYFAIASYVLLFLSFLAWRTYILLNGSNLDLMVQRTQQLITQQNNDALKIKIQYNNNLVSDYNNLYPQSPKWSKILIEFANLVPNGVVLNSFNASSSDARIDIAGTAATRDEVLLLRQNIANAADFKNINLPLENIAKPDNVDFHYTFYVNDNVLVPKK